MAIVASWRPDVAVVDLRRPDATGSSLCAALKEQGVALTLVASSLTEAELLRASREAFADGYVSKARGVRAFVSRIEELVARSLGPPSEESASRSR
jgi:two-component system, OmpR family, response regulator ResD